MILKIRNFCKFLCKEITIMYIAMNRFKIVLGREIEFENIWRQRDTHLKDVPGFETVYYTHLTLPTIYSV